MQNANAFGAPDCIQKPPRPEMSRSIKQFSKTTMQHYAYHGGTDEAQTGAVGNLSAFLVGAGAACLTPVPLRVLPAKVSNGPRIPKSGGGCPRKRTKSARLLRANKGRRRIRLRQCVGMTNQSRNMHRELALIASEKSGRLAIIPIAARDSSGGLKQDFIQTSPCAIR